MERKHIIISLIFIGLLFFSQKNNPKYAEQNNPSQSSGSLSATRQELIKQIKKIGAKQTYAAFKEEYSTISHGEQHPLAHIMGEVLYDTNGVNGLEVCDNDFAFGCYHGFFIRAVGTKGIDVIKELDAFCVEKFGPLGTGCQHGLGHGIMEFMGNTKLIQALEACTMTTQLKELFGCTSGVFMEYNIDTIVDGEIAKVVPRTFNPENPYEPCNTSVPARFKKSCYYELPQWFALVHNRNYAKIGTLCHQINETEFREFCFLGLGNIVAPGTNYNIERTRKDCALMPDQKSSVLCLAGASWSFFADPKARSQATDVCENTEESEKSYCLKKSNLIETDEKR